MDGPLSPGQSPARPPPRPWAPPSPSAGQAALTPSRRRSDPSGRGGFSEAPGPPSGGVGGQRGAGPRVFVTLEFASWSPRPARPRVTPTRRCPGQLLCSGLSRPAGPLPAGAPQARCLRAGPPTAGEGCPRAALGRGRAAAARFGTPGGLPVAHVRCRWGGGGGGWGAGDRLQARGRHAPRPSRGGARGPAGAPEPLTLRPRLHKAPWLAARGCAQSSDGC